MAVNLEFKRIIALCRFDQVFLNTLVTTLQTMCAYVFDLRDILRHIRTKSDRMFRNVIAFYKNIHNELENIDCVLSNMKKNFSSMYQTNY